jgi:hypothetical protein
VSIFTTKSLFFIIDQNRRYEIQHNDIQHDI